MRIGLATPVWIEADPDFGIAGNYYRLASALAARGHDVTVFHLNDGRWFWRRPKDRRINGFLVAELPCRVLPDAWRRSVGILPTRLAGSIRFCWNIRFRFPRLDVIEATSATGFAWLYCRLNLRRPPVLIRFSTLGRQVSRPGPPGYRSFLRLGWFHDDMICRARHLCTHTVAHRDKVCGLLGVDPGRVRIIPHGVFPLDSNPARPPAGGERMVLYVGRFEARKGTDCLLAAIPKVLDRLPDCRFVLAGGGGMADFWRKEFPRRHGSLATAVRFLGRVPGDELESLYARCDFFVSPATYESFGMTYLEAMRHGRPVIGCEGSGSAEVIGDAGLVVRPGDADALASAIVRLWTDRNLHRDLSAKALLRAAHYSMERKIEKTERAYEELIRQSRTKTRP